MAAAPSDAPPRPPAVTLTTAAHLPRTSVSSSTASDSTDLSPTTTASTFDSPITVSPQSLPDSPAVHPPMAAPGSAASSASPPPPSSLSRPPSPPRCPKPRNLKNLTLALPAPDPAVYSTQRHASAPASPSAAAAAAAATAAATASAEAAAASDSLPPPAPPPRIGRRKPPNLTIQTPKFTSSFCPVVSLPPTPTRRHTHAGSLRHAESSPTLPSLASPTVASFGFFPPAKRRNSSSSSSNNNNRGGDGSRDSAAVNADDSTTITSDWAFPQLRDKTLTGLAEEPDTALPTRESHQAADRGYPNGPVLIYENGLYLYLEPSADEAARFDVVINVAKEVPNPFADEPVSPCSSSPRPSSAPPTDDEPSASRTDAHPDSRPEYVHVPWDHHSEILDDLFPLCQLIDDRVGRRQRVLVHCQLGVSRSASLVIAYGLFKHPDKDFSSVYGMVKDRSSWVGPNMSLIYQLTDFRARVLHGGPSRQPPRDWFEPPEAEPQPEPEHSGETETKSKPATPPAPPPSAPVPKRAVATRPLPLREKYNTVAHPPAPTPAPASQPTQPSHAASHASSSSSTSGSSYTSVQPPSFSTESSVPSLRRWATGPDLYALFRSPSGSGQAKGLSAGRQDDRATLLQPPSMSTRSRTPSHSRSTSSCSPSVSSSPSSSSRSTSRSSRSHRAPPPAPLSLMPTLPLSSMSAVLSPRATGFFGTTGGFAFSRGGGEANKASQAGAPSAVEGFGFGSLGSLGVPGSPSGLAGLASPPPVPLPVPPLQPLQVPMSPGQTPPPGLVRQATVRGPRVAQMPTGAAASASVDGRDPRSPPPSRQTEPLIMRSIDEVL